MQKFMSYGRLSGSVFFISWSECTVQPLRRIILIQERSWLIIQPQELYAILTRSVHLNAHKESTGKKQKKTKKTRQATIENIFIKIF